MSSLAAVPTPTAPPVPPLGLEAIVCTIIGVCVSGGFVRWLLMAAESRWGRLVIGWAFVLPAGVLDTIPNLFGASLLTRTWVLTGLAAFVGGVTGYMGGRYQAYDWKRKGWLQFAADLTWGLSGSVVAALMHGWNALQKLKPLDRRTGAHRYAGGFTLGSRFAFTQGAVMSNLDDPPGSPLFIHEKVHILQHRLFGPIYPITYVSWSIVGFVLALIASTVLPGFKDRIEGWAYFSNPWEVWAYQVHGNVYGIANFRRSRFNIRAFRNGTVIAVSMIFFPALLTLFALVLVAAF